jgi:hypothetical protein
VVPASWCVAINHKITCFDRNLFTGKRIAWTGCKTAKGRCGDYCSIEGDCPVSGLFCVTSLPPLRRASGVWRARAFQGSVIGALDVSLSCFSTLCMAPSLLTLIIVF